MADIMIINSKLMLAAQMRMLAIEMFGLAEDIDNTMSLALPEQMRTFAIKMKDQAIDLEEEQL